MVRALFLPRNDVAAALALWREALLSGQADRDLARMILNHFDDTTTIAPLLTAPRRARRVARE
jgi:hypothetical protein